jgi:hypothetical protein
MAPVAFALLVRPEQCWQALARPVRNRVAAWLGQINRHALYDGNWLFFRVLVNRALAAVGAWPDQAAVDRDLAAIDRLYQGDGWYTDGLPERYDYYGPMAFHFYGLLCVGLGAAGGPPALRDQLAERARRFAPQFAAWFAPDGAALPYGRSLAYRFAQGAFWGALAFAGVEALPWGVVKGLYLRHLRWWFARDMLSDGGLLTIGYGYPHLTMAEAYVSPGSPYWATKAFLPLALPATHPFWTADELAEAGGGDGEVVRQARPRFLLCRDRAHRHLYALSNNCAPYPRVRYSAEKYAKFVYSTVFAFSVPSGGSAPECGAGDSMLLLSADGRDWRGRDHFDPEPLAGDALHSRWQPWPDVTVDTWLLPVLPGHVRIHRLRSARPLQSFEGGFPLPYRQMAGVGPAGERFARAENAFGVSLICDLHGTRRGRLVRAEPNTNLLHPLTVVPGLGGEVAAGETWLAAAVIGLPGPGQGAVATDWCNATSIEVTGAGPRVVHAGRVVAGGALPGSEDGPPAALAPLRPLGPNRPAGLVDRCRARLGRAVSRWQK